MMHPLLLLLIPTGIVLAAQRRRMPGKRQQNDAKFIPRIMIGKRCETWAIPDAWWEMIAFPKYEKLVNEGNRDADSITYAILDGETGDCQLPPSMDVQIGVPQAPNYWSGSAQMLYLAQHVREAVQGGLSVLAQNGKVELPILGL